MKRFEMSAIGTAFATLLVVGLAFAQAPSADGVVLDRQSAGRALDAVPAVLAVARNVEGVEIDVSIESVAQGIDGLAGQPAASDQLAGALGAYGFDGYGDWAATIETIFTTYRFIRSQGLDTPSVKEGLEEVLSDPSIPENQKERIAASVATLEAESAGSDAGVPSQDNLEVVISLLPHIESTIETVKALK